MKHDEEKLPLWAQELIYGLRIDLEWVRAECNRLRMAHEALRGRDWFIINGPSAEDGIRKLWSLDRDSPWPICDLGPGDILLVGRRQKDETNAHE